MSQSKSFLSLDVGEKRIGVAVGDSAVRIAVPYETITVDGKELERIARLVIDENTDTVIVGYPRNQSGETTAQTEYVEEFAKQLVDIAPKLVFQDESLTSVIAEQQLKSHGRPYEKGDIDAQAAAIILQDYLEQHY
jgi:putative Holliday junction resolvase